MKDPRIKIGPHVLGTATFMGCVRMLLYVNRRTHTMAMLTVGRSGSVSTSLSTEGSRRNKNWRTAARTRRVIREARAMRAYHGPNA